MTSYTEAYIPLWVELSDLLQLITRLVDVVPDRGILPSPTGAYPETPYWMYPHKMFTVSQHDTTLMECGMVSIRMPLPRPIRETLQRQGDLSQFDYFSLTWVCEEAEGSGHYYHQLRGECVTWRLAVFERIVRFFGGIFIPNDDNVVRSENLIDTRFTYSPACAVLRALGWPAQTIEELRRDDKGDAKGWRKYQDMLYAVAPITIEELRDASRNRSWAESWESEL